MSETSPGYGHDPVYANLRQRRQALGRETRQAARTAAGLRLDTYLRAKDPAWLAERFLESAERQERAIRQLMERVEQLIALVATPSASGAAKEQSREEAPSAATGAPLAAPHAGLPTPPLPEPAPAHRTIEP